MSLQQKAFCAHLDNVFTTQSALTRDIDIEIRSACDTVVEAALLPSDQTITHKQYKLTYSMRFYEFYKVLKRVQDEYTLIAPGCSVRFQDVPSIMAIIYTFDTNYHRMCQVNTDLFLEK